MQEVLDFIEENLRNELSATLIAEKAGYSVFHFNRIFAETVGISPMSYAAWRRMQHALFDLTRGKKVVDAAMDYGFETHAGFTKAFTHWFGFPPSLCRLRLTAGPPAKPNVRTLKNKFSGGNEMNPHIIEMTPFAAVGYPTRHKAKNLKVIANDPTLWNTLNIDFGTMLGKLYDAFTLSKHFEICMCYDIDEAAGEFSYVVARGIDAPEDLANIQPDMTKFEIAGGLYAVFSTPPTADLLDKVVQDTWNDIFLHWLPQSEFEYDDTRRDFTYHDYRDHGWYFGGKLQVDFCIPIRQKEEEARKS